MITPTTGDLFLFLKVVYGKLRGLAGAYVEDTIRGCDCSAMRLISDGRSRRPNTTRNKQTKQTADGTVLQSVRGSLSL